MKKDSWPYLVPFLAFLLLTYAGTWILFSFTLTGASFEELRNANVSGGFFERVEQFLSDSGQQKRIPGDVLENLSALKNQEFAKEGEFLIAVEQHIGKEHTATYKKLIVKHAKILHGMYLFYPLKTLIVAALLWYYRKAFTELKVTFSWLAVFVGIVVFIIWVVPEGWYPQISSSEFNPFMYGTGWVAYLLIVFRLAGAALVVPVFEELFWRSWAIRWIIHEDFKSVPIGKFTWFSCLVIIIGFGFEHHRWLVGLIAGVLYNGLLYYKKDLPSCILAHGVTNLLLGIYVLVTQQWSFW